MVPVYPFNQQGVFHGDDKNAAAFGLAGVENGYVAITDVGLYHAVPGNMNGQKAVRAVGGYEGPGDLKKPPFGVILRFPARACGGFLLYELDFYRIVFQAGGSLSGKEPVKVDPVASGQAVKKGTGRFKEAGGDLRAHRH
jgi:hypothetical protein